ncbi:hypothetical protein [Martelella limonii]|uniref:hypothetical protein n=1 Tax=Martelella limonii TaxID=1647649 RepID=UPI001580580A|nr:hypothetical protein [Martelella limonii]
MAIPRKAYREKLRWLLAGRPVIQVRDLWVEAGLDRNCYAGTPLESYHHARLIEAGYRPVSLPVLSGTHHTFVLVRSPCTSHSFASAIDPGFLPYLEDGDPLMALLVYRAQKESGHGRT